MSRKMNLTQKMFRRIAPRCAGLCSILAVLLCFAGQARAVTAAPGSTTVVINQVYGGGGNSGAPYTNDYVELFNLSASPVALNGYAIQYLSATASTGTAAVAALPNFTLQPGQHYLVQLAAGTATPGPLPVTPDATFSSPNLSATTGRVFLTSTVTPLSAVGCATTNVVDFVGYGTAACSEGTKAPAPANATALARVNQCSDTDQNGTDFAVVSPSPKNSSSTLQPCGGSSSTTIRSATATPSTVTAGNATLLTATGTTGLSVSVDLSAFSGLSNQQLYDDGTNGDATANDGTYSYSFTVPSSASANTYTLTFTGKNTTSMASNTVTTTLTVTAPIVSTPIHTIQGNTPGTTSYNGQTVQLSGIVTSVTGSGFYMQARDSDDDNDPHTPEGIYIYTGSSGVPSVATVGTELQLTGKVALYPTTALVPGVEITGSTGFKVLTTNNALPAPIALSASDPSPSGGIYQLPYLAGMRVSASSITVTQPTDGNLTETAETYTSNGQFWGEITGLPRPTREAGLDVRDAFTASQASTIPRFDSDPETFVVDSQAAAGTANTLNVSTGTILNNVLGVVDLSYSGGLPRVILDATTHPVVAGGGMSVTVAPAATANEISIADQNMERFYNDQSSDNAQSAVTVTTTAYQNRLSKASLGIRNVLGTPDIVALEEMENLATLNDLSAKISSDASAAGQTDPQYAAYLVQGNDVGGINVGFLVKPSKVNVISVDQFGKTTTFTNASGAQATLNDRPPLVLHATVNQAGGSTYPLTVIVNHLRSLNGVTDATSTGATVRLKRKGQAEYLANLVQQYQSAGEHVIVVGDFNAFDVNDGLVDSMGIIKGNPAPANQDVLAGTSGLVTPNLVDVAPTDVPNGAYSYVFNGYAQSIDHFLVTQDIASQVRTVPAHWNADFPVIYRNDPSRPEASSDHDGIVGYVTLPSASKAVLTTPAPGSTLTDTTVTFSWTPGTNVAQYVLYVGKEQGGLEYYSGTPVYTTSQTISGLPNDGSTVYVRLWSYINGGYQYNDYTYTAVSQSSAKAVLTSPAPGSTLPGTTATFNWTAGTRVAQYVVYVGSQPGGLDIYSGTPVYTTSQTISGLPTDGRTVYVRLWSYVDGGYQYNDYTYTAYQPAAAKAEITSPAPGSTLAGPTVNFTWTPGTRVAQYVLYVGTQPGGLDIYSGTPVYTTSQTISGIPTDGSTVYVRLWSYIDGGYQYNDYTYTAASSAP